MRCCQGVPCPLHAAPYPQSKAPEWAAGPLSLHLSMRGAKPSYVEVRRLVSALTLDIPTGWEKNSSHEALPRARCTCTRRRTRCLCSRRRGPGAWVTQTLHTSPVSRQHWRSARTHRPALIIVAATGQECIQPALVHAHQLQPVQRLRSKASKAMRPLRYMVLIAPGGLSMALLFGKPACPKPPHARSSSAHPAPVQRKMLLVSPTMPVHTGLGFRVIP